MARLLGFTLLAVALWASIELYTKGVDGAFGGALAEASAKPAARSRHAAGAFQRAFDKSEIRVDHALKRPDN